MAEIMNKMYDKTSPISLSQTVLIQFNQHNFETETCNTYENETTMILHQMYLH